MQIRVHRALAAAALVSVAAAAQAQTTPTRRIPVSKDRTPTDTVTRTDTVTVYRTDTVTVRTTDTVTVTQQASTGMVATETPMVKLPGDWYFQLGGGATMPQRRLDDFFDTGFNVTGSLGWQPVNSPLGLRFDVGYDRFRGEEIGGLASSEDRYDDASVWSGLAEATLGVPFGKWGSNLYLIGGGGIHHFGDYNDLNSTGLGSGDAGQRSSTDWGVNGGAGIRFAWGRAALFAESRYFHVFTENEKTQFVPIIAGFTFR